MIEKLYRARWTKLDGLGALVLTPTRELALQIFEELVKVREGKGRGAGRTGGLCVLLRPWGRFQVVQTAAACQDATTGPECMGCAVYVCVYVCAYVCVYVYVCVRATAAVLSQWLCVVCRVVCGVLCTVPHSRR